MTSRRLSLGLASLFLLAPACGGGTPTVDAGGSATDTGPVPDVGAFDAGMRPDSGPAPAVGTCTMPRMVSLELGTDLTVVGDTSTAPAGALDLGTCGEDMPAAVPAQDVIAVQVPGTGDIGIELDLTMGGDEGFDTVVQVRTSCEVNPASEDGTCFDDAGFGEIRSGGRFIAMGGTTIYLVVTGFAGSTAGTSSGAYSMILRAQANSAPTLTAARARRVGDARLEVFATGSDAEMNAVGVGFQFLDAAGTPLAVDPMMATEVGPYFLDFDVVPTMAAFTDQLATGAGSGAFPVVGTAVTLRVFAYDDYDARSATRDVAIDMVAEVGFGESCDATRLCAAPNTCEGGACVAPAATRTACMGAMPVTLTAPTATMSSTVTRMGSLAAGEGVLEPTMSPCGGALATEQLFAVTLPAGGPYDLVASTNNAGTDAMADTVVYLRTLCEDAASETVCDDDYDGAPDGDVRSVAVAQGLEGGASVTVIVDGYDPFMASTPVQLDLTLRAVLATGAACDPMGVQNRCMTGPCPAMGAAVCP